MPKEQIQRSTPADRENPLKEVFLRVMTGYLALPNAIDTPQKVLQLSLRELDTRLDDQSLRSAVEEKIVEFSQNGQNLVFIGGNSPRDNFMFEIIGARHQQISKQVNLFIIPVRAYNAILESVDPEPSQFERDITNLSDGIRGQIGVE